MAPRPSIAALLDRLLPRACLLCGERAQDSLCPGCLADLPRLAGPLCPLCATPLPAPAPACGECLRTPPAFDQSLAPLRYAFPADRLVLDLKFPRRGFAGRLASADFLARCMLAGSWPAGDLILPVPLSRARLVRRGFNQAIELARPLARALGLPLDATGLVRVRDTQPQSGLPQDERAKNVRHAFAARRDYSGLSIIVVDDVMTSGATLDAIARTLKASGATRVVNWTAVRTVRERP